MKERGVDPVGPRSAVSPARGALDAAYRAERGRILAGLYATLRDFDLAQEALHEASARALVAWQRDGIPDNPGAWLATTARRRAIDVVRRRGSFDRKSEVIATLEQERRRDEGAAGPDELELMFTCCHPALEIDAQVALTLNVLGGLTTDEVARAFLVKRATMAQRIVRAKAKVRRAGIPFRVPPAELLPTRLEAVLAVVYLIFNEGYSASRGDRIVRADLCQEAIRLSRLLARLMPGEAEALGLLALLLLHDARRPARVDSEGRLLLLEEQDRGLWDHARITAATTLLKGTLRMRRAGPYQIQAAIAALHAEAPAAADTDWPQIVALYDALRRHRPGPVVELNRAVAVAMAVGVDEGLRLIDAIEAEGSLADYHLLHAARADLYRRAGRPRPAAASYRRALELVTNDAERALLERRLAEVARG